MKTIIITGGFGMVGSNLVFSTFHHFDRIVIIDSNVRGMKSKSQQFLSQKLGKDYTDKVFVIESDVRSLSSDEVNELILGEAYFVHLADIVAGIGYVFNNQYHILTENVTIDVAAFELALAVNVKKVVYASTACVFNQNSQRSIDSKVSIEKDLFPSFPESTYGWAKLYGELAMINLFEGKNISHDVIYFHNMVGYPCDYWSDKTQVIPSICKRILDNEYVNQENKLSVWGSGNQGRALVPVHMATDFVTNNLLQINQDDGLRRMQYGPDFCTSVGEMATKLNDISDFNQEIVFDKTKPEGDIGRSVAEQDLPFGALVLQTDIDNALLNTFNWIKENYLND